MRADEGVTDLSPAETPHDRIAQCLGLFEINKSGEVDVDDAPTQARVGEALCHGIELDDGRMNGEQRTAPGMR